MIFDLVKLIFWGEAGFAVDIYPQEDGDKPKIQFHQTPWGAEKLLNSLVEAFLWINIHGKVFFAHFNNFSSRQIHGEFINTPY